MGAKEPNMESPLMALSSPIPLTTNHLCALNFRINPPAAGPPQGSGAWARCCLSGPQRGCSGWVCSGSPALPGVPSICSHSAGLSCKQLLNDSHPATTTQRSMSHDPCTRPLAGSGLLGVSPLGLAWPFLFQSPTRMFGVTARIKHWARQIWASTLKRAPQKSSVWWEHLSHCLPCSCRKRAVNQFL